MTGEPRQIRWNWLRRAARPVGLFAFCFLLVAAVQWPYRDLPFWGDSLGYMIVNTRWMWDHGLPFHPIEHDPGHPPLASWVLLGAWKLLGRDVAVSHAVQWMWAALLMAATYSLVRTAARGSRLFAALAALLMVLHPVIYSLAMQLVPDLAVSALHILVVAMFYARRRLAYAVALALLLLVKVNAWPLVFFFGVAEFVVIPLVQFLTVARTRRARRALAAWWTRWAFASLLAGIPLGVWLVAHWSWAGFPFMSPMFADSGHMDFSPRNLIHQLTHDIMWSVWWKEGNKGLALVAVMATLIGGFFIFQGRKSGISFRRVLRGSDGVCCLRPPWMLVLSLAVQALGNIVLFGAKELKILRFFLPVHVIFVLLAVIALSQCWFLGERVLRSSRVRLHALRAAVALAAAFSLGNMLVRHHPMYADLLPLPQRARWWFMNDAPVGYEYNLLIVPSLEIHREATRHIEAQLREAPRGAQVVANYPLTAALRYPEAGFLAGDRGLPVEAFSRPEDFDERRWDYYLTSPLVWHHQVHEQSAAFARTARVERVVDEPQNWWRLAATIYINSDPAAPRPAR